MFKLSKLKNVDLVILGAISILSIIGLLNVFSTTYYMEKHASSFFFNQIIFDALGILIMITLIIFNYKLIKKAFIIIFIYLITIALLALVLKIGVDVFGTRRWINLGAFNLQPSELAKLSLIIISAYIFTISKFKISNIKIQRIISHTLLTKIILLIFLYISTIFLIFLEKSLGNTVLTSLIFIMLISAIIPINKKLAGYLIISAVSLIISFGIWKLNYLNYTISNINLSTILAGLALSYVIFKVFKLILPVSILLFISLLFVHPAINYAYNNVLESYQRQRIESYITPDDSDTSLTTDWNKRQSIAAIGSAGLLGKGFLNSKLANIGYLPFAYTDFAYAAYAEQFGFIGSVFLVLIYLVLLFRIISKASELENDFGKLICFGVAFMIFLNTVQHIGMNMGKLPITGVPLPFISYGGSSLLTIYIGIGLVLSILASEHKNKTKIIRNYLK